MLLHGSLDTTTDCTIMTRLTNTWNIGLVLLALSVPAAACDGVYRSITDIQGSGSQSPQIGERVSVRGVITLDARGDQGLGGFFLQQPEHDTDASSALFIYTRLRDGAVGEEVAVTGTVTEYHGLTELTAVDSIKTCGPASLPPPVSVQLPLNEAQRESLEGMRIALSQPLQIIDHHQLADFGTLTLAPQQQTVPTQLLPPGDEAWILEQRQQLLRLILDDGRSQRGPVPTPYPDGGLSRQTNFRTGTVVTGLDGILDYRYQHWRLQPLAAPRFEPTNPRPQAPAQGINSNLRLMTLNLGNYFNGEQGTFTTSRGARNRQQWLRQTRHLVAAIEQSQADVLAASELENDGYGSDSAIASLAEALGAPWRYVIPASRDSGVAITVGFLYRADRVRTVGHALRPPAEHWPGLGRRPLLQHFQPLSGGETVRLVLAHFKSKHCRNARGADRDQHDGQGCFANRRTEQADALTRWLATLPAQAIAGTLVTGDLNSYAREWPIQRLRDKGFRDLINDTTDAPAASYRYQGRRGTLDYSLADRALADHIVAARIWAINADEPRALDFRAPAAVSAEPIAPWRSSDHDPLITDLQL